MGVKRIEIDFRKEEVVFIFEGTYVIVLNIFLTVKWACKTIPLLNVNLKREYYLDIDSEGRVSHTSSSSVVTD